MNWEMLSVFIVVFVGVTILAVLCQVTWLMSPFGGKLFNKQGAKPDLP